MVDLAPTLRLDDTSTQTVLPYVKSGIACVRMQDLVTVATGRFNYLFYRIKRAGGVHNFLGFKGIVILSTVMQDPLIKKIDKYGAAMYINAINTLKPNYYMTPDGTIYDKVTTDRDALYEISRILILTKVLIRECSGSKPVGLIKGSNEIQVDFHINALKNLGIEDFTFHTGDFFRHGSGTMIKKARMLCSRIRPHAKRLMLYGMGSQRRAIEFSFADVYATQSHFIAAQKHTIYNGCQKVKYNGSYSSSIVEKNFIQLQKNIMSIISHQTKLTSWMVKRWEEAPLQAEITSV